MLLPELKSLAGALGIKGTGSMKKAQLLDAIKAHQAGQPAAQSRPPAEKKPDKQPERRPAPDGDRDAQGAGPRPGRRAPASASLSRATVSRPATAVTGNRATSTSPHPIRAAPRATRTSAV